MKQMWKTQSLKKFECDQSDNSDRASQDEKAQPWDKITVERKCYDGFSWIWRHTNDFIWFFTASGHT